MEGSTSPVLINNSGDVRVHIYHLQHTTCMIPPNVSTSAEMEAACCLHCQLSLSLSAKGLSSQQLKYLQETQPVPPHSKVHPAAANSGRARKHARMRSGLTCLHGGDLSRFWLLSICIGKRSSTYMRCNIGNQATDGIQLTSTILPISVPFISIDTMSVNPELDHQTVSKWLEAVSSMPV
jgi:hypothetical protein